MEKKSSWRQSSPFCPKLQVDNRATYACYLVKVSWGVSSDNFRRVRCILLSRQDIRLLSGIRCKTSSAYRLSRARMHTTMARGLGPLVNSFFGWMDPNRYVWVCLPGFRGETRRMHTSAWSAGKTFVRPNRAPGSSKLGMVIS